MAAAVILRELDCRRDISLSVCAVARAALYSVLVVKKKKYIVEMQNALGRPCGRAEKR